MNSTVGTNNTTRITVVSINSLGGWQAGHYTKCTYTAIIAPQSRIPTQLVQNNDTKIKQKFTLFLIKSCQFCIILILQNIKCGENKKDSLCT